MKYTSAGMRNKTNLGWVGGKRKLEIRLRYVKTKERLDQLSSLVVALERID